MSALFTTPALVVLGIYTLVVFAILWANHRLHRKPKPVRAPYPPPAPPTDCHWCAAFDADALWLAPWPANLTDQQVDRLFDDIVAIEGLDR